ncbi:hypothetical protein ACLGEQ_05755, partial [Helicobacter pylori]
EFEIFFKMSFKMTETKKPVFKNKSFSNRAKNSVIKKFKILTLFKNKPSKIGDKAVFLMVV